MLRVWEDQEYDAKACLTDYQIYACKREMGDLVSTRGFNNSVHFQVEKKTNHVKWDDRVFSLTAYRRKCLAWCNENPTAYKGWPFIGSDRLEEGF